MFWSWFDFIGKTRFHPKEWCWLLFSYRKPYHYERSPLVLDVFFKSQHSCWISKCLFGLHGDDLMLLFSYVDYWYDTLLPIKASSLSWKKPWLRFFQTFCRYILHSSHMNTREGVTIPWWGGGNGLEGQKGAVWDGGNVPRLIYSCQNWKRHLRSEIYCREHGPPWAHQHTACEGWRVGDSLSLHRVAGGQAAALGHTSAWLLVSLLESRSPDSLRPMVFSTAFTGISRCWRVSEEKQEAGSSKKHRPYWEWVFCWG